MNECLLFHDWEKWEQVREKLTITHLGIIYPKKIRGIPMDATRDIQRRKCKRCGKVQEEEII